MFVSLTISNNSKCFTISFIQPYYMFQVSSFLHYRSLPPFKYCRLLTQQHKPFYPYWPNILDPTYSSSHAHGFPALPSNSTLDMHLYQTGTPTYTITYTKYQRFVGMGTPVTWHWIETYVHITGTAISRHFRIGTPHSYKPPLHIVPAIYNTRHMTQFHLAEQRPYHKTWLSKPSPTAKALPGSS